jgi:hypothetical protein
MTNFDMNVAEKALDFAIKQGFSCYDYTLIAAEQYYKFLTGISSCLSHGQEGGKPKENLS